MIGALQKAEQITGTVRHSGSPSRLAFADPAARFPGWAIGCFVGVSFSFISFSTLCLSPLAHDFLSIYYLIRRLSPGHRMSERTDTRGVAASRGPFSDFVTLAASTSTLHSCPLAPPAR